MATAGQVARVSLRYSGTRAQIIGVNLIEAPAPVSFFSPTPTSTGAWLTVLDPDGREVFHQPLPDPYVGGEVLGRNGAMRRLKPGRRVQFASVETPWPGPGAEIEVHAREVAPRQTKTGRAKAQGSVIARLPLKLQSAPKPGSAKRGARGIAKAFGLFSKPAKLFPMTVDGRWGHDNPKALNLVFMPEGFLAGEIARFHAQVDVVIKLFEQTKPYSDLLKAMKVVRLEIPSATDTIDSAAGRTFFKAHFTTGGIARVIDIDQTIAAKVIFDHCPNKSARGLVVVNTETYGGSGGVAAVFSCVPVWSAHIAIHELGHSHFGLADEYSEAGQAATKDPVEPNVCSDFRREGLKWAHLVGPDIPLPTWREGDPDPDPAAAKIGAFEGGKYQVHGIWRPAFDCKMRHVQSPTFCTVCQDIISRKLEPYLG
jgi:hypothetical protein